MDIFTALLARLVHTQHESLELQRRRDADARRKEDEERCKEAGRRELDRIRRPFQEREEAEKALRVRVEMRRLEDAAKRREEAEELERPNRLRKTYVSLLSPDERTELERIIAADKDPQSFWTRDFETTHRRLMEYFHARYKGENPVWHTVG